MKNTLPMRLRDTSPLLCLKVALNCFIVTFSLVANCFPCSFSNSSKPGKFRDLKLASITEKKWATMNPLHSMIIGPGLWSLVSRVRQIFQSCSSLGYEIGATRRVEFRSFVALAPREPLPVHSLKTRPVTAIKSAYGWENLNFRYPIPPKNCKFGLKSCSGISAPTRSFRIQN